MRRLVEVRLDLEFTSDAFSRQTMSRSNSRDVPDSLAQVIGGYQVETPLARASTIPAAWYVDPRVLDLEQRTVFRGSWQVAGRLSDLGAPGDYITCELPGGEPVVVVRGPDHALRAFYNVCRHHAAAVVTGDRGSAQQFRCPYHGWTYALDGALKGTPDFAEVCDFDRAAHGLVPMDCDVAEKWVWVRLEPEGPALTEFLGPDLSGHFAARGFDALHWMERRHYTLACNWKVFVDNYLDGGYHVPHVHRGLDSVLSSREYTIETGQRFCLQWSPMVSEGADTRTGAVRQGEHAFYYWIYPNFMINCYGHAMDTNLVIPLGVDRTEVVFDFYFTDVSETARAENLASIAVSQEIQDEDVAICVSVQRGLRSRAYDTGRLSVRREAGEHLFHRLLHVDLTAGLL
jgi:phenylpropionate dioxygenase-like ring-hydroxylating dioxygenase large terminal subunit